MIDFRDPGGYARHPLLPAACLSHAVQLRFAGDSLDSDCRRMSACTEEESKTLAQPG